MSETPTELIEQFLIDNTKIGRTNFFASEIVASALADYEIIPRSHYEALMAAKHVLLNCEDKYSLCLIDAEQGRAGTEAIRLLRASEDKT